ncbi:MAG: 23S rRNA (uracil(1939)-C(5))-methyltransferase RlmD [Acetatifactor sp.]|nr:23S rRNA (uracil(1939)-C(5))-methyltransferase RlmD [Acetatifactor sp.]
MGKGMPYVEKEHTGLRRGKRMTEKQGKNKVCSVSARCGGCQRIDEPYEVQLQAKAVRFRKMMEPFCKTEGILGMERPEHYRCKVNAAFGEDRRHNVISGIYEEKSHRIVPVDSCLIENEKADAIIVSIRGLLKSFKIRPYNEDTGYGLLRHVLVRTGHATGQILVVLVLSSPILPSKNNFVKALLKLHPEITSIVINVNERNTSMVLGDREHVVYGKGYIEDRLCGKVFRISPKSFYQVNPMQTEKLYGKAVEYAALTGKEMVLDAYCGTGTIGLIASEHAGRVIGVELNGDAVRDARSNAKRNQVKNIQFYQNDAGKLLLQMAEQGESLDVLLMDPPRSGSSREFLEAAARISPGRIVYISCNPETLVRDLKILAGHGYRVERSVAVDMFPFTEGIESVSLLVKHGG